MSLLAPPSEFKKPLAQILGTLRWAQALHGLGDATGRDFLDRAYELINRYDYPGFREAADALARSF